MDLVTIAVASGLRSRTESLDMLANNMANAGTAGYKKDVECYGLYLSQAAAELGAGADPATPLLPVIERPWTDFSPGVLEQTGNPLDFAISGKAFFAVEGSNGPVYTRNGRFRISGQGRLETIDGLPVRLTGGRTLTVTSPEPLEVTPDGTVWQAGEILGRLEVMTFADPSTLVKAGRSDFRATQAAVPSTDAEVLQGKVEGSNVGSAESAVRLVNVMRQFEMLTRAAAINGEMNRKATDEVARVGS